MNKPSDSPIPGFLSTLNQGDGEEGFPRVGPLLDVERFQNEYLFGVPMRAYLTGQEISPETLKQFIRKGVSEFETSVRVPVTPTKITDKFDFERSDDLMFGTRQLTRWPVIEVVGLAALFPGRADTIVQPTGDTKNYGNTNTQVPATQEMNQEVDYPTNWISLQADCGLVRIVPNSGSLINADATFINSIGYKALTLGNLKTWPNVWRITYIAGFEENKVPDIVNDLIGIMAAIKFLSQMGPAIFPVNSFSIGIDGMSQGTGTAGPQWLSRRIDELREERDRLVTQLKAHYATDLILTVA